MKRRLVNFIAGLSLLLFAATAVMWLRSEFVQDVWSWQTARDPQGFLVTQQDIVSNSGRVYFDCGPLPQFPHYPVGVPVPKGPVKLNPSPLQHNSGPAQEPSDNPYMLFGPSISTHSLLGFAEVYDTQKGAVPGLNFVQVPYWALAVCLSVLPLIWARRRLRLTRRRNRGQCLVCGYDLRASPERCPECGTIPS